MFTIRLEQEASGISIHTDREFATSSEAYAYATSVILDLNEIFNEENSWTFAVERN